MKTIGILTLASIVVLGTTAYGAKAITVTVDELPYEPSNGYPGMKKTDVSIKSLYDDKNVYYLIASRDPTKSLARFPWVKQADGSWKKLAKKDDTRP
jgi:hypothetical protein